MDRLTVLVTSVGTPIAHGVLKGLKELNKSITIIGVESRAVTAGNKFCDRVYQVPRFLQDEEGYFNQLNEIIEKESVDALFSCHPPEIYLYEEYKERLSIPFSLPTSPHFSRLRNKEESYKWLIEEGMEKFVPTYYSFDTNEELLQIKKEFLPNEQHLIVKEVEGYGATGFALLTNREQFLEAVNKQQTRIYDINDYVEATQNSRRMVMKQLEKPEYSVDTYVHDGEMVIAVPRNRSGVSSGLVIEGSVVKQEELIAISKDIVELFVEDGFINLQFMKEDGQFKLTDINPRFCGSHVMSLGAGVNFPELFLSYNLTDDRPIPEPIWNTRMYRYRDSFFYYGSSDSEKRMENTGAEIFLLNTH